MYAIIPLAALVAILLALSRFFPRKQLTPLEETENSEVETKYTLAEDAKRAAEEAAGRTRETAHIRALVAEAVEQMRTAKQAWNDRRFKDARLALETATRLFNDIESLAGERHAA